ncbi:MAG: heterodisulfide reductase-related iron-sulfur binding cluster, partial [Pyrinomonadaceae bacterium]
RCLGCRACESACPAGVQYGQLLEAARADIASEGRPRGWTARLLRLTLRHLWLHPRRLALAFRAARLLRDSRLPHLLLGTKASRFLPGRLEFALALLDSSAPPPHSSIRSTTSKHGFQRDAAGHDFKPSGIVIPGDAASSFDAPSQTKTRSLLFKGCVTEGLFSRVNHATARVLEANGCSTFAPDAQGCCGALHAHAGDIEGARVLARRNIDAFADTESVPVITNAGGCGAMLASYAQLLARDSNYAERAQAFSVRVRDVSQQLALTGIREGAAGDERVTTYDASCHLLHGQKAATEPLAMLAAIRALNFVPLEGSDVCCGGAGVYNLVEPDLSGRILDEKLRHVEDTRAQTVVTGNPGCHMQLGAGARLRRLRPLHVCHPVELLDESYKRAGYYDGE